MAFSPYERIEGELSDSARRARNFSHFLERGEPRWRESADGRFGAKARIWKHVARKGGAIPPQTHAFSFLRRSKARAPLDLFRFKASPPSQT